MEATTDRGGLDDFARRYGVIADLDVEDTVFTLDHALEHVSDEPGQTRRLIGRLLSDYYNHPFEQARAAGF